MTIDLNCDLGEGFGAYSLGDDAVMLGIVTSANIACGFHAGDPGIMARTVQEAHERGVAIGAHPGLPDLAGFGRREMAISPDDAYALTLYQIGALAAFARANGTRLHHVKPHGALYHQAERDAKIAEAIARAVRDFDPSLILYALSGGHLARVGESIGLQVADEVFADRAYLADGSLVPRHLKGAVITDAESAAARMVRLLREGCLTALDGIELTLNIDTICVHGDTPNAVDMARILRAALESEGFSLRPPKL